SDQPAKAQEARPRSSQTSFALGTLVRASGGIQRIESIRLGEMVLSQNTATGELSFQPVIRVDRRASKPVVRIATAAEMLVATSVQRFWRAGQGWVMARDLSPGDRVRAIGGCVTVKSRLDDPDAPVIGLEVAQNHDLFVGGGGLLVHDAGL